MPRSMIHSAMGENLAILGEIEFTLDEAIGELPWINRERTDVAGDLLGVFFHSFAKDHFENPRSTLVGSTVDERNEMGVNREWNWRRSRH